ncbi:hypothetical protein Tco_0213680 [Tanacetum coccineum]
MCTKMVPEEEDRVEKFIGGLPDNIKGNVIAAEPTRLQDVVRIANNLMDQKRNKGITSDCPKIKNQNHGNKARVLDASGRAYALGGGDVNPGSNTVTGLLEHPFNIDLMPIELGSFDLSSAWSWSNEIKVKALYQVKKGQKNMEKALSTIPGHRYGERKTEDKFGRRIRL